MIDFGDETGTGRDPVTMEFVGGPRRGERGRPVEFPARIPAHGGFYRRSVRCADDEVLRYVWEPVSREDQRGPTSASDPR